MMSDATLLERLLRRDRAVVITGLLGVILLSWSYLLAGAGMGMMAQAPMEGAMADMPASPWSPDYAALMVLMWAVMMLAMMLPGAAPMILLFATINRKRRQQGSPYVRTGIFALGYLVVWVGFSVAAVGLQWSLDRAMLLSPGMAAASALLGGGILVAAGVYQLTPLKDSCLRHCRSPLDFVLHHWRNGPAGAFVMGLHHGLYCLGCCWVLMLLLFVGGIMNLLWVAAIAAYVLLEKTVPAGHWLGRAAGAALVAWGGMTMLSTVI